MPNNFAAEIQIFNRRVRRLMESYKTPVEGPLGDVLEELGTSLEELRVAEEELAEQSRELQLTRAAVEEERRRYRDLFLFAPEAYLVTDGKGTIAEGNHAAGRLLGVPIEHLSGKPLPLFVSAGDRATFQNWLRRLRAWTQAPRPPPSCASRPSRATGASSARFPSGATATVSGAVHPCAGCCAT